MDTALDHSRTRSIAYCALSIAFIAVSAWVTVPFGPVPFTLQTLAITFVLITLKPKEALATIAGYIALGAVGLPVFSSFKGGLAALLGPTGGFIIGYLVAGAVVLAMAALLQKLPAFSSQTKRNFFGAKIPAGRLALNLVMGVVFLAIIYVFGWAQLMAVGHLSPEAAFAAAVAPFVALDLVKMVVAVILSNAVRMATRA